MNFSSILFLFCISIFALFFRLIVIPASDYPDINVVAGKFLTRFSVFDYGLSDALQGDPTCVTQALPNALILGSSYYCDNVRLNVSYVVFGLVVILGLVITLLLINFIFPIFGDIHKRIAKIPIFLIFLPCLPYYLVSPHTDIAYNFLGIVSVYALICSSISPNGRKSIFSLKSKDWMFVISLAILAILPSFLFYDNQMIIVALIIFLVFSVINICERRLMLIGILDTLMQVQASNLLQAKPVFGKKFLSFFLFLLSLVFVLFYFNVPLMKALGQFGGPLGKIGSHYSTYYVDLLSKYPLPLRWLNILQTAVIRTSSWWGPSFFSWMIFIVVYFIGVLKMLSTKNTSLPRFLRVLFSSSILFVLIFVAVGPGYSNFKYYISLLPVFVIPLTFIPGMAFLAISAVYLDLLI